jgi:hypothetical protein
MNRTKTEPNSVLAHQVAWLLRHSDVAPRLVSVNPDSGVYTYKEVPGEETTFEDTAWIIEYLEDFIWGQQGGFIQWWKYCDYVQSREERVDLLPRRWSRLRAFLEATRVASCGDVHGDCTYENVIKVKHTIYRFIDPGLPRGAMCRENDLAKLQQSAVILGFMSPTWPGFTPEDIVTRILEYSHWVRLIVHPEKHEDWDKVVAIARERTAFIWNNLY